MAVANSTIIQKMITELNKAKLATDNPVVMVNYIKNVQLLADLLIEAHASEGMPMDDETSLKSEHATRLEMNEKKHPVQTVNHDEANGDSIFDF